MKKLVLALAMVACLASTPAFASEGRISNQSLSKMGLAGMKPMTDEQGLKVRGAGQEFFLNIDIDIDIDIFIRIIIVNVMHHHHHHH